MTQELANLDYDNKEMLQLMKDTICKGSTDDEFKLFTWTCKRLGLDPLARQVYPVKRWDASLKRESMTIQTSIDGYRLIADRTGKYAPGKPPAFTYEDSGKLLSATSFVQKQTPDGTWHEVGASAYYSEYAAIKKDGTPTHMWLTKPLIMLSKCFDDETEVLTNHGFRKFSEIKNEKIMELSNNELKITNSKPFSQDYSGEMISVHSDMLDFCVTPNHDMITTFGRVEAEALYKTTTCRGPWRIPLSREIKQTDPVDEEFFKLLGYILADGWQVRKGLWNISVSRNYKLKELMKYDVSRNTIHSRGVVAKNPIRDIKTNFDKICFNFTDSRIDTFLLNDKSFVFELYHSIKACEAKLILDAWQYFDGHTNKKTGLRRIYTSKEHHCDVIEFLACKAGYTISSRKTRQSDISDRDNFYYTISSCPSIKVVKPWRNHPGLIKEMNFSGKVWCVTVPSNTIIVRRKGFSMICGNCAEALALRKAFPAELSGAYTKEEMEQADNPTDIVYPSPAPKAQLHDFLNKWSKIYDKNLLMDYIEKHSEHFKQTAEQVVMKFLKNEKGFVKECDAWMLKTNPHFLPKKEKSE